MTLLKSQCLILQLQISSNYLWTEKTLYTNPQHCSILTRVYRLKPTVKQFPKSLFLFQEISKPNRYPPSATFQMPTEAQVIGGHKANLHNPNTSSEAKEHSKDVLREDFNGET